MPMFDWSAGPGQTVVFPHFWVYWAFAIPLTVLVLALWLLFMSWSELRRKRSHGKRQKRRVGRSNAKHPFRSFLSRIQTRRKRTGPDSGPEKTNEAHPRDMTTPAQQKTIKQIEHTDSANTGTTFVKGEREESKQRSANYGGGYDYLFPRIDPDSDPQEDAMSSSETKLDDLGWSGIWYK